MYLQYSSVQMFAVKMKETLMVTLVLTAAKIPDQLDADIDIANSLGSID